MLSFYSFIRKTFDLRFRLGIWMKKKDFNKKLLQIAKSCQNCFCLDCGTVTPILAAPLIRILLFGKSLIHLQIAQSKADKQTITPTIAHAVTTTKPCIKAPKGGIVYYYNSS